MEVLDDGAGDAADRAESDIGITAHVQDRPGGGKVDRRVSVVRGGGIRVRAEDERTGVDVHREGLAAEAAELQDAEAFLIDGAAGKDRSIDGQADLLIGLTRSALDRGESARDLGDGDRRHRGQAETAREVRDDADIIQVAGADRVR